MLEGLDAVDWRGLEAAGPDHPATNVPKVLRRIARADATTRPEAVERAYGDLQDLLLGRVTGAGTAALPFLADLALDPDTAARPDLVEVLADLAHNGETGEAGAVDSGWEAGGGSGPACGHCSTTRIPWYGGPHCS
ncbi:hypothetical protein ACGFYQ_40070 [Streptomyces sp. NPDC048258]|uniref:hypothetical protein n=1 Tax=Streptomyces sp. NPDC048258 TaxID=3365527 RepID=UPI0037194E8C